jgi:predicted dehydrogenase
MAERIYNISIAGCGKVAPLHAKAIQNIPNARQAGVWRRTPKTAEDFISAIKTNKEPSVTGEAGRRTVELFTAIYRSTRDNMPVKFPLNTEPIPHFLNS